MVGKKIHMPEFDPEKLDLKCWLDLFEMTATANGVNSVEDKRSLLFASIGLGNFSTVCKLTAPELPSSKTFDQLKNLLTGHFITAPSYHKALCEFLRRKKTAEETVKEYYAELKKLAQSCEFGDELDRRLKEQLLVGIDGEVYFKILLADPFDFKTVSSLELLNKVINLETAYVTESTDNSVNKLNDKETKNRPNANFKKSYMEKSCKCCGKSNHASNKCKLRFASCHNCHKKGHIRTLFRTRTKFNYDNNAQKGVSSVDTDKSSNSYDILKIVDKSDKINYIQPFIETMTINDKPINFELDSGSAASTLGKSIVDELKLPMVKSCKKLCNYDGFDIKVLGEVKTKVKCNNMICETIFYIVDNKVNLAGRDMLHKLNFRLRQNMHVNNVPQSSNFAIEGKNDVMVQSENQFDESRVSDVIEQDYNVMDSTAVLNTDSVKGKTFNLGDYSYLNDLNYESDNNLPIKDYVCNIDLKNDCKPKYFKSRNLPFHHREKIDISLTDMVNKGIIEQIDHSDWASPIVPVMKSNGTIRICADLKYVNSQINISKYHIPKIEEILASIGPCNVISKLDLENAYLHLEVNDSQKCLVINTPKGLYRYKRLPFGLASAPAMFQKFIDELLVGITGVVKYLDEIIVVGSNKAEHDQRLLKVLKILKDRNVCLN